MKSHHSIFKRSLMIALFCTIFTSATMLSGCSDNAKEGSQISITTSSETEIITSGTLSSSSAPEEDSAASKAASGTSTASGTDSSENVKVKFSGTTAEISGPGAAIDGSTLTITAAGTYELSGTWQDGQVHIKAGKDDTVRLILNGVSLSHSKGAAIYAEKCSETILQLASDTDNTVIDSGSTGQTEEASVSETGSTSDSSDNDTPNAAIFIQDDLTILGDGTLTVTGSHNGITSKDNLTITGGTLNVTADHHGITGKDNLTIDGGTVNVTAKKGDGLRSTYSDTAKTDKGHITVNSGTVTVNASEDGVQAEKNLTINNGTLNVTTGGGAGEVKSNTPDGFPGGFPGGNRQEQKTTENEDSKKGLKAGSDIIINGGVITLDTYDDAIHANADTAINNGTLTIRTGDDAIHADNILNISGGTTLITQSYEGLEAIQINISDGSVDITASDDGINAAGGNDNSGFGNFDGQMDFGGRHHMSAVTSPDTNPTIMQTTAETSDHSSESATESALNISGGTICVNAGGDGLDSNSTLNISGGTIIINGPSAGGNGIIDHDGTCKVTGGFLIGAGTSDMLEMPGSDSTQKTVAITLNQTLNAGTLIYVLDGSGQVIAAMQPEINYGCLILNRSLLKDGETYTVYTGGTVTGTALHGYYSDAAVSGGTQFTAFTASDAVTYVNENGVTTGNNFGGMGGPGGMGGHAPNL